VPCHSNPNKTKKGGIKKKIVGTAGKFFEIFENTGEEVRGGEGGGGMGE